MSIKHLRYPQSPHEVHDDLESILWVLVFIALHRFKQNDPANFRLSFFSEMDYQVISNHRSLPVGGNKKLGVLLEGSLDRIDFTSRPVITLMEKLVDEFSYYSPHIRGPGSRPLPDDRQLALQNQHIRLENRNTILSIFQAALDDPTWDLDDWAVVDKYPCLSASSMGRSIAKHDSNVVRTGSGTNRDPTGSGSFQSSRHSHSRPGRTTTSVEDRLVPSVTHSISSQRSSVLPRLSAQQTSRSSSASSSIKRRANIAGFDDGFDSIIKRTRIEQSEEDQRSSPSLALFPYDFPQGDSDIDNAVWLQDDCLGDLYDDSQFARPSSARGTPPRSSPASSSNSRPSSVGPSENPDSPASHPQGESDSESFAGTTSANAFGEGSTQDGPWASSSRAPPKWTYGKRQDRKGKGKAHNV